MFVSRHYLSPEFSITQRILGNRKSAMEGTPMARVIAVSRLARDFTHQRQQISFGVAENLIHKSRAGILAIRCGSSSKCTPASLSFP
jgi:hypothetical protein